MKKYLVDTNFILRFLLKDNVKQARQARDFLHKAKQKTITIYVPLLAFVEVVFILTKLYKFSRVEVSEKLTYLAELPYLDIEKRELLIKALSRLGDLNVSFVDLLFYFEAKATGRQLFTFDKKLLRIK